MKMTSMSDDSHGLPILVRYYVGDQPEDEAKEMAIFVESVAEAQDFVHMSLRWAVKTTGGDTGAAELFHVHTKEKLGRMAVLFDDNGSQGIAHEQWTWVAGANSAPLH